VEATDDISSAATWTARTKAYDEYDGYDEYEQQPDWQQLARSTPQLDELEVRQLALEQYRAEREERHAGREHEQDAAYEQAEQQISDMIRQTGRGVHTQETHDAIREQAEVRFEQSLRELVERTGVSEQDLLSAPGLAPYLARQSIEQAAQNVGRAWSHVVAMNRLR
jgi:hypothetical protein